MGVVDAGTEFSATMIDVYLLAEGSAFLGGFSSNLARLAYSLMAANGEKGGAKPFYSGDMNWCWAWGRSGPDVSRVNNMYTGLLATC